MIMTLNNTMSERSQRLLRCLVKQYINDGQPVGSKVLVEKTRLSLSSSTVRHIMADLEERGYLSSPHTSAGRVPTARGYRLFVDGLIASKTVNKQHIAQARKNLASHKTTDELMQSASVLMSNVTHLAGIASLPTRKQATLRRIEFLPLSGRRVLTVLVLNTREVQNRIIKTERDFSASELQQATNYLNEQFAGKPLQAIRTLLLKQLQHVRQSMNKMMKSALDMAATTLQAEEKASDYVMAGQTNLLHCANPDDIEGLKLLFDAFNEKHAVLHLLDRCLEAGNVQIFIGKESGHQVFDDWSIVTAPYYAQDKVIGVLGVIGPQRMQYDKVISTVDVTAKLLTAALKE
jgi:heat-inducible transcriptional repressor